MQVFVDEINFIINAIHQDTGITTSLVDMYTWQVGIRAKTNTSMQFTTF